MIQQSIFSANSELDTANLFHTLGKTYLSLNVYGNNGGARPYKLLFMQGR